MKYVYIQLYNLYRNYPKFLKYTQFTKVYIFQTYFLNTKKDSYTSLMSKSLLSFCLIIPLSSNGKPLRDALFSAKYKLKFIVNSL